MDKHEDDRGPSSSCAPRRLQRLKGSAKTDGPEYEFKLAGLLSLRARIEGLYFEIYTNVKEARPCDDVVLIILKPEPAVIFVQLKHGKEDQRVNTQAFVSAEGDFSLRKYFEFYEKYLEKHSARESLENEDERALCACAVEAVRFAIFTNRGVRRSEEAWNGEDQGLPFPLELDKLFRTGSSRREEVFSFGERDVKIWPLKENDPQEGLYHDFLSRLRLFVGQSNSRGLEVLIKEELNRLYGAPLPAIDLLLPEYLNWLKDWAQDDSKNFPLSTSSHEVEDLLAAILRKRARGLVEAAELVFREEECRALRDSLILPGDLYVSVHGVPVGHRGAKMRQVLDGEPALPWTYVDDEALRAYPMAALRAACGVCAVVVVDVEERGQQVQELVAAVATGRKLIVLRSDADERFLRESSHPANTLEEQWSLDQLTAEAQEKLMECEVRFQGSRLLLRDLQGTWPSVRQDVDGALLSALVRGRAVVGAPPPVDDHKQFHVPRTVAHPSVLSASVLNLPASSDHLVLKGFSRDDLQRLRAEEEGEKRWNVARTRMEKVVHTERFVRLKKGFYSNRTNISEAGYSVAIF